MNEKDRAELEQTRRMVENLEREFDGGSSDYQPTIKKTTSTVGYTQNPIKSSRRDEKSKTISYLSTALSPFFSALLCLFSNISI